MDGDAVLRIQCLNMVVVAMVAAQLPPEVMPRTILVLQGHLCCSTPLVIVQIYSMGHQDKPQ